MSSQNNWNNPDMYYTQDRSQQGPSNYGSGAANGYQQGNAVSSYNANAAYGSGYGGAPAGYQQLPPTNTLAIIGMVVSIFGTMSGFFLAGIAGIIMGHMALKQIRTTGERGEGMAKAALWVGYIGTALWVLFWVVYVLIFVIIIGGATFGAMFSSSVG